MSRPSLAGAPIPARKPTTWLAARLRAPWLDRDLAAGVAPWRSRAHAARALQLTGDRHRRAMAHSLERLIQVADRPTFMCAAIPPRPEQVHDALPLILAIAATLRDGAPVDASGVARLSQLLSDGGGPCYARARPGALRAALETVSQWLEVLD
jgi:hypothetical protein